MIEAERARDEVQKDVTNALGAQLPDGRGWELDEAFPRWERDPLSDDESGTVAVPWTWHGMNEGLLGLAATHREVTLRGLTVVTERGQDLLCQRYVDWLPALQQAGIVLFTRPIVQSTREFSTQELDDDPDLADLVAEVATLREALGP
jgi:hypothetical protein